MSKLDMHVSRFNCTTYSLNHGSSHWVVRTTSMDSKRAESVDW